MSTLELDRSAPATGALRRVPFELIDTGTNDRKAFDPGELEALAASIVADGLVQVPTLRPVGARYVIVAGERRVRAMRDILGWSSTEAMVREYDDDTAANVMLVENMVRVDLDPLEEAAAYRARLDRGATIGELSRLVGVGQATIKGRVALLELGGEARHMVSTRQLPVSYAALMVGLDVDRQHLALTALAAGELSVDGFRAVCSKLAGEQADDAMFDASSFWSVETYVCHGQEADTLSQMGRQALLPSDEVAKLCGITETSLRKYRNRGVFPAPDRYFGREPGWYPSTVTAWLTTRRRPGQNRKEVGE